MKTTSIPGPTLPDQRTRPLFKQILAILYVSLGPEFLGGADLQPETYGLVTRAARDATGGQMLGCHLRRTRDSS